MQYFVNHNDDNEPISGDRGKKPLSNAIRRTPRYIRDYLKSAFENQWDMERATNSKLGFYNQVKDGFGYEKYLSAHLSYSQSKHIAQLRTSSHPFNIEKGRHGKLREDIKNRLCSACTTGDQGTVEALAELPFFDPIVEDELHVLRTCQLYEDIRQRLSEGMKNALFANPSDLFQRGELILETAKFLTKIWNRRFPKKKSGLES